MLDLNQHTDDSIDFFSARQIGMIIKEKRRAKKISQKKFAGMLGKSERTIQKYEAGEIDFNISTIREIAGILDISWFELLNTKSETAKTQTSDIQDNECGFSTLGDIFQALMNMTNYSDDLKFTLELNKPPEDNEWSASLKINGKEDGKYNSDFCLFIENWMSKLQQKLSPQKFDLWKNETIAYYSGSPLHENKTKY